MREVDEVTSDDLDAAAEYFGQLTSGLLPQQGGLQNCSRAIWSIDSRHESFRPYFDDVCRYFSLARKLCIWLPEKSRLPTFSLLS
ncbi:hypothetical protein [Methylosarcina fibrata]|jgi:hypothetical protein|uniref:hypothetical protein n=1 Tax=Methylosarcina fibrata TaxID=105972 RepID=UPI0012F9FBDD|nr:hypothetical protein [Methylosarcina fibrata]